MCANLLHGPHPNLPSAVIDYFRAFEPSGGMKAPDRLKVRDGKGV
jgi:hypothetical protein